MTMKKTTWIGLAFLLVVFGVVLYSTMSMTKFRVKVCMQYNGQSNCATAAGSTKDYALRQAISTACAPISGGVTGTLQCERTPPGTTEWK
jgi:hypothetical protein